LVIDEHAQRFVSSLQVGQVARELLARQLGLEL
jgi:hypothetical protein